MSILLTGASGFVGSAVLKAAERRGCAVRAVFRSIESAKGYPDAIFVNGLHDDINWKNSLQGVRVVIHTAARKDVRRDQVDDQLNDFLSVNVEGALNVARLAAAAGVQRFVFISSVKVNGEATSPGTPFTADDLPAPEDSYARSKAEAEARLKQLARETGMAVTIIRAPLIYGPGAKGNFESLIRWVSLGIPLPFGGITHNARSLVSIDNLIDLIFLCVSHPNAANQILLVSDGEDVSTTELLREVGKALGRPARLFCMPLGLVSLVLGLIGKKAVSQRLIGTLQLDISKTRQLLGWRPTVGLAEGLRRAVE